MIVAYINREAIYTGKFEILIMDKKYNDTMEDTICRYYQETKDESLKNYLMKKYGFMNDPSPTSMAYDEIKNKKKRKR